MPRSRPATRVEANVAAERLGVIPMILRDTDDPAAGFELAIGRYHPVVPVVNDVDTTPDTKNLAQIPVPASFPLAISRQQRLDGVMEIERRLLKLGGMGIEPDQTGAIRHIADIDAPLLIDVGGLATLKEPRGGFTQHVVTLGRVPTVPEAFQIFGSVNRECIRREDDRGITGAFKPSLVEGDLDQHLPVSGKPT